MVTELFTTDEVASYRLLLADVIAPMTGDEKIHEIIAEMSNKVYEGYQAGLDAACLPTIMYDVRYMGEEPGMILAANLSKQEIEKAILLDHGFMSWTEAKNVGKLDKDFEKALNDLLNGELDELKDALIQRPDLLLRQSKLGHQAGLIHYLTANGVELWRQIVPANAAEILKMMLDMGANPYQDNKIFAGTDLLSLIETSENLVLAGKMDELIAIVQENR